MIRSSHREAASALLRLEQGLLAVLVDDFLKGQRAFRQTS